MTRINTNVSSLLAQNALNQSNQSLQTALTRLSTGLRINSAADDPSGLIASDALGSEIASTQQAVSNTQQADEMISTADSALTQVTTLLTNIRGLISAAANTGTMSADQIQANQQQIDASLNAIDQISETTQFQGQSLLDGSLGFVTQGVNTNQISNLNINQVNFGTSKQVSVAAKVLSQGSQASLSYNGGPTTNPLVLTIGGANGYQTYNFAANTSLANMESAINADSESTGVQAAITGNTTGEATAATKGQTDLSGTNGGGITLIAKTAGQAAGNVAVVYNAAAGNTAATNASYNANTGVLTVNLKTSAAAAAAAIANVDVGSGDGAVTTIAANVNGSQFNGTKLVITDNAGGTPDTATYNYATNTITASMNVTGGELDTDLNNVINAQLGSLFTASGDVGDALAVTSAVAVTDTSGNNGGVLDASDTYGAVATAITNATGGSPVVATAVGTTTNLVSAFTQSASIGSVNTGQTTDLNNGIQFLGNANASYLPITFVNGGDSQTLGISLGTNTATNGYSTAYVQGANANSTIKITAGNQGTQYDGITVQYAQATNDQSVVYNAANKTLTVNNNFNGGAVTAAGVIAQINAAFANPGGTPLFTASDVNPADPTGAGATGLVVAGLSGTTSGGNQYTGITVNLGTDSHGNITSTAANVIAAINGSATLQGLGISAANLGSSNGTGLVTTGSATFSQPGVTQTNGFASGTTINRGGVNAQMTVTAKNAGSQYNNTQVVFVNDQQSAGNEYVSYDADTNQLQVHIDSGVSTLNDVLNNFTAANNPTVAALFSLSAVGSGAGTLYASDTGTLTGGVVNAGTATGGVALAGNFDANNSTGTALTLTSTGYGSDQFVSVDPVQGSFATTNSAGQSATRDTGSDVNVLINGMQAVGNGLQASIDNPDLSMSFNVGSGVTSGTTLNFNIIGGGAQFQLGPNVTSAQQTRIGIGSVSTASLGGASGLLYELQSGGNLSLTNNIDGAAQVCDQAISQVADASGRLGAFQSTTLETNVNSLSTTLANLTSAKSNITDADFAAETASLEQAQILQQSGLTVLSLANAAPKQVLTLLQNL
jgi:flagellin-like hook-associated protein FlgL